MVNSNGNGNGKRPNCSPGPWPGAGAPPGTGKGNTNAEKHSVITFRNQVKRRTRHGRSLIDRRTRAGQNALAVRDKMLADMGGESNLSTAKLMLIEMIARDTYFLDETDRRIFRAIYKLAEKERAIEKQGGMKNPKLIATLYSYRQGAANNLARNLLALGLEKLPPKQKTLEEILNEPDGEESQP